MIRDFKTNYAKLLEGFLNKLYANNECKVSLVKSRLLNFSNPEALLTKLNVTPNGDPIVENTETIFIGKSILTNNTSLDQKLKSDSFTRSEAFTTSTKTTQGFNIGGSISASFGFEIKIVNISTSITINASYNFSKEELQSSTITNSITAPSQDILVPANSSVEVVAYFNKGVAKGKVNFEGILSGSDEVTFKLLHIPTGETYTSTIYPYFRDLASINNLNPSDLGFGLGATKNDLLLKGTGEYSSDIATQYLLAVTPINKDGKKMGETTFFNVLPKISEKY
ncbi:ETX/MTX2 family pore-forming toxin [Clostridium perfringens]|uniref:ETX/MTX2 family pore-forming toxin n=2 Tax=Bacillota TaxID=1239 RepID=A0A9X3XUQ7_ENTFC|nr:MULTISPECIES: ETX/MTX2 family pore-forming toxin [Bacillota]ELC8332944.1 ETX/MTX2 family pore-forming toxin [Clostridium perfringens]MBI6030826.1 ETX/MTX2 family pore-forming toxin [Clostridium perfringens]MBI6034133.1 ETX/MTX2 family pore-forming toxin [Clostridium perfringens]MBI6069369.1 ETX/MTX2 family pore-forming toxin [Clostridium perfringens]MBI6097605.1 ETX/MTX2 family pore-forming toxin [Clostridium perfringens]